MRTTDAYERLTGALTRMDDLYGRLLDLGAAEQQAMIELDTAGVHATVSAQEELLPLLAAAEEARQTALADLTRAGAIGPDAGLQDVALPGAAALPPRPPDPQCVMMGRRLSRFSRPAEASLARNSSAVVGRSDCFAPSTFKGTLTLPGNAAGGPPLPAATCWSKRQGRP